MKYKNLVIKKEKKRDSDIIEISEDRLVRIAGRCDVKDEDNISIVQPRLSGELAGKALYLDDIYDWIIGVDEHGLIVLVPLKK